jgi:DNA-binding Lrp family transcriptional regulator
MSPSDNRYDLSTIVLYVNDINALRLESKQVTVMDDVDKKIIAQLQINGRTTLEDLSKLTGYTSMGTKKRLQKLLDKETIKVSASVNTSQVKLLPAIVMMEVESGKAIQTIIDKSKNCPRVVHMFKTMGGYNLMALVVAENQDTLECISSEKCSLRSGVGIRRSEFYPVGDAFFSPFLPVRLNLASHGKVVAPCGVNCEPCAQYQANKCVGCPATKYYRGSL